MSFRTRLFLALALAVLVPLVAFAWGIRAEMERRLAAQATQRAAAMAAVIRADLDEQSRSVAARLRSLAAALAEDGRFRQAVAGVASERAYLLDYAGHAMQLAGLSMLQIQDASGRILCSGHFRNEYDRLDPELPRRLAAVGGAAALVRARTASGPLLVLARVDSLWLGRRACSLVGGLAVEEHFLARLGRDRELTVALLYPEGVLAAGATAGSPDSTLDPGVALDDQRLVDELKLPYLASAGDSETQFASIVLTQSPAVLRELEGQLDLWFVTVAGATLVLALLVAAALSARISRPLAALARKTTEVDLRRLDVEFASDRNDEIGDLSRLLGAMTERLRAGARTLREVERRAAVGDLARQVNHDIKNGLVPIRNVLHHLAQVARAEPERLREVFTERQATLASGLDYLENLAANYARLSPPASGQSCDLNAAVREAAGDAGRVGVEVRLELASRLPMVRCDPVAMRRILENLVANAMESLQSRSGAVTLSTASIDGGARVIVTDTGRGMTPAEAERAFEDFYTTKPDGTGLGLSIVRRLVRDAGGSVRLETTPGSGSRFIVELQAAGVDAPAAAT